ncbi:MAG: dTDP-4-dehydro-6-deoxyglucose aminotransferase [Anaerolineales bacterium]|nr:dTDP-4-dehydro-6-deoxyglucose aminotransferase [Anaerolineales bacterium]
MCLAAPTYVLRSSGQPGPGAPMACGGPVEAVRSEAPDPRLARWRHPRHLPPAAARPRSGDSLASETPTRQARRSRHEQGHPGRACPLRRSTGFNQPLYFGRPNIPDRRALLRSIEDLLDRRWLRNNGPYVKEFAHRLAGLLGVRHCVATCNATLALELTARALAGRGHPAGLHLHRHRPCRAVAGTHPGVLRGGSRHAQPGSAGGRACDHGPNGWHVGFPCLGTPVQRRRAAVPTAPSPLSSER